ncbi:hypothetical protein [Vibrio panuliri]|uniref:Uncharacterized protein n=1 Tax=Vibrio panuliri TaxID=1381081 RepID=A0A1Q9HC65_9VIBR|nr:hypothetical protein [Vibrio panuliri]KAB1455392.1 hypothetical protein F7O85_21435 [Vibrio panuliri]OLQ86988.1 hypothetical protein BIY22_10450 [Vibrio panuliri]OLQ95427.1 hypothetical protein BIY20_06445 [Vibrio panuliri]
MELSEIKRGMLVESLQGSGRVLVIDEVTQSLLIENSESREQFAVGIDEIVDEPQLHHGCDQYY